MKRSKGCFVTSPDNLQANISNNNKIFKHHKISNKISVENLISKYHKFSKPNMRNRFLQNLIIFAFLRQILQSCEIRLKERACKNTVNSHNGKIYTQNEPVKIKFIIVCPEIKRKMKLKMN